MAIFNIADPVIGLAPMDGITDAAFRFITNKYGRPDISYTEFVHVMGLIKGGERLWQDFYFVDSERPILAQLFGTEVEYFYHASKVVAELGFDGVDINMGCPARSVTEHGAGAALIRTPKLAQEIITAAKRGVRDWYESGGELTGVTTELRERIVKLQNLRKKRCHQLGIEYRPFASGLARGIIPVSVKTRIGYDTIIVADWIKTLTEADPNHIALHGRTLKQLYSGSADWQAIATGVAATHLPVLANGDIKDYNAISKVLVETNASGVLIGRATYGNPWFFSATKGYKQTNFIDTPVVDSDMRARVMLEHAVLHVELKGAESFVQMRKHLGWYAHSSALRSELVRINSINELEEILGKTTS